MDTAALNARFTSPPVVTFDDLYHVLRHTLLSPFFTGGLLAFTHLFQVNPNPYHLSHCTSTSDPSPTSALAEARPA